jgi:hypothetical protein
MILAALPRTLTPGSTITCYAWYNTSALPLVLPKRFTEFTGEQLPASITQILPVLDLVGASTVIGGLTSWQHVLLDDNPP